MNALENLITQIPKCIIDAEREICIFTVAITLYDKTLKLGGV